MKEALWGYWLIILGIFVIVVLLLVQSFTSTNTQDYYLVKTITEAAMEDAIDWSYYRLYGEVKINKEKFYETFLRRFAEEASLATTYTIEFTEVYEAPPKVGVKVSSKSSTFSIAGDSTTFDIVNKIDAILENRTTTSPVKENDNNDSWETGPIGGTLEPVSNEGDSPELDEINADRYNGCTTYYITTCTKTICNYTKKDDKNETGTVNRMNLKTEIASNCEDVETECSSDFDKIDASGSRGYAMVNMDVKEGPNGKILKKLNAGDEFKIIGASKENSKYFLIEDSESKCGVVLSSIVGVHMQDFFPKNGANNIRINITNASSSIYYADNAGTKIHDGNGNSISNVRLYSSAYKPIAAYPFAQQILKAAQSTSRTLVIYDLYRPYSAAVYMGKVYQNYLNKVVPGSEYAKKVNNFCAINSQGKKTCGFFWFLTAGLSTHNTACAVDITFEGATNFPTKIHVLHPDASYKEGSDAKELYNIMTGGGTGLTTIPSEWWHFENKTCHSTILGYSSNGATFWSNY